MLLDKTRFSFIAPLEEAFSVFISELSSLDQSLFKPWPDRGAYLGSWLGIPLCMASTSEVDVQARLATAETLIICGV